MDDVFKRRFNCFKGILFNPVAERHCSILVSPVFWGFILWFLKLNPEYAQWDAGYLQINDLFFSYL